MLTRTDRRRFPILIAAIATLALAGAALGLLFSTVQAQEDQQVLLSNLEQSTSDGNVISNAIVFAQGFTTGSNTDGYHLASIELGVFAVPNTPANVTIALWSATSASEPNASVATLTHSTGTWATGVNAFDAPADTELDANTTYFVHIAYSGGNPSLELNLAESTSVDDASAADWSIGQVFHSISGGNWVAGSGFDRFKFRINGRINGPPSEPTINQPSEIRAYWTGPDPDNDQNNGNRRLECAGTEPFRAYWERPKRADEWEAEVEAEYGASNPSFTLSKTGESWPELTGTVDIQQGKFSTVSIRVRGRFGDDGWGAWSPVTELFCNPPGGL